MNNLYTNALSVTRAYFKRLTYEYNNFDKDGDTQFATLTIKITDLIQDVKTDERFAELKNSAKIEELFKSYLTDDFHRVVIQGLVAELLASFLKEEYEELLSRFIHAVWVSITSCKLIPDVNAVDIEGFISALQARPWLISLLLIRHTQFDVPVDVP